MLKANQKTKKNLDHFLNLLVIILIIFFNRCEMVYGANNNLIEVSKTVVGIEYIDRDSIKNKNKGIIEITTKYLKIDDKNSKEIEENIYRMRINCLTNKFKDISVNGKKILNAKWEDPNGDKLLNDLIFDSYKNV